MPFECLQSVIMFKQALILTNFSVNYYQNYSDNAQIYEVNKEIFDFFEDGFSSPWLKFSMVLAHLINWLSNGGRVSIQGVKSLWGDRECVRNLILRVHTAAIAAAAAGARA